MLPKSKSLKTTAEIPLTITLDTKSSSEKKECKGIGRGKDLTGKTFGYLEVLQFSPTIQRRNLWKCRCKCGAIRIVCGYDLGRGATKSCGCLHKKPKLNITGRRFGKLVAEKFDYSKVRVIGGRNCFTTYWLCRCDCGNKKSIILSDLRQGKSRSCGCECGKERTDRSGKRNGKLTFISFAFIKNNKTYWNCQCDCGKNHIATFSKNTKSCGCDNEKILARWLKIREQKIGKKFGRLTVIGFTTKNHDTTYHCKCDCGKLTSVTNLRTLSCGCATAKCGVRGSKHYLWRSDLTKADRAYRRNKICDPRYSAWIRRVYRRDNYTCQLSSQRGGRLAAHHISAWSRSKSLRFKTSNGITISLKLHKLFHSEYGRGYNTPKQFSAFKKRYQDGEFQITP